jgi:hypothetical protein
VVNPLDPSQWNRYVYTGGDPVNHTDPTGLCSLNPFNSKDDCYSVAAKEVASWDWCGAAGVVGTFGLVPPIHGSKEEWTKFAAASYLGATAALLRKFALDEGAKLLATSIGKASGYALVVGSLAGAAYDLFC